MTRRCDRALPNKALNPTGAARPRVNACAQHARHLGGASPPERRPSRTKRTATAKGRPIVGRKQGAKPRADEQEPDMRRRRAGRVGPLPQSLDGQSSGYVDPAVVRGRKTLLPGEISPCARKGDGAEAPEREVSRGRSSEVEAGAVTAQTPEAFGDAKDRTRRRAQR